MLRLLPLCSLVLLLAAPAAAPAYASIRVFRADHATAALPGRDSRDVVLRPDRGPRRTVAPPTAQCSFWAAGTGRLVWDCGATIVVTDLHGGDAHQQPNPFYAPDADVQASFQIDQVGSDWVGGVVVEARAQDGSYWLNWRTGAQRSDSDDVSPTAFPDLGAPGLFTPLCAGARRLPNRSNRSGAWGSARAAGHWVVTSTDTYDSIDRRVPRADLHRCGTRDAITIRGVAAYALSASWLAWSDNLRAGRISLRHLRDGRIWHRFLGEPLADQSVVLTDRYVYSGTHRRALPQD
jgi:hypothetical protein